MEAELGLILHPTYRFLVICSCIVRGSGSTFTSNSAGTDGGGLANEIGSTATVSGSTFTGDSAGVDGGGIKNFGTLTPPLG